MAVVNALRTKISLDSAQFQQSMAGVNRQLKALQQEQRAVTSSGTGFARGIDELTKKADVLRRTHELQQRQVEELRKRYEESRKATGENSKETQNAQIAYNKAVAEMNKTENALKNITAELERQRNPWLTLQRDLDEAGKKLQNIGKGLSSFGRSMSMRVTTPILGAGVAALKVGMDFEAGMSQVQALTNASAEEMAAMSEQAKYLGETTRFSASQAAEGMAFLGMAGWKTNEIIAGMPGLLNLAASSNMELGRAADITSNIMAAFNIQANEAVRVADLIAYAASNANTNVEQMGEAMKYVAPTANTLGLSIEDTAAAIMSVSDAGIQGSQAGRAFGTSLLRLSNPTSAMIDQMEELGVKFFDAEGVIKSLPEIIGELEKAMSGFTSEQKAAALATIFGTEAQRHWAILLDRGSANLRRMSNELENSEGTAERMAQTMQNNAKGAMVEFQSALEGVGIALSEHMIPAVTDIIRKGTDLVRKFGDLDKSTQQNIIKMGLFAAAIGPVAIVAGSLTTTIGGLVRAGSSLAGLLGTARGTGLLGRIAMLGVAGPVGLAIAGVGLLGGAIYTLTRNKRDLNKISLETIQKATEEVKATDELISQFEELQRKNRLTSDEMLEYLDILSDLEKTSAPEAIAELTSKKEYLLQKSGLTNEEMEHFIDLNNEIIDKAPDVEKAISSEGNAYVENLKALKELNEEKRRDLLYDTEQELVKILENQISLMEEEERLAKELEQIYIDIEQTKADQIAKEREIENQRAKVKSIEEEINKLVGDTSQEAIRQRIILEEQKRIEEEILIQLNHEHAQLEKNYDNLNKQRKTKRDNLDATRQELKETEELIYKYEQIVLMQAGITAEKGKGLDTIKEQIRQLEIQKRQSKDLYDRGLLTSQEYQEQVSHIDEQINRLKIAKGQLEGINELAGRTIYNKQVFLSVPNLDEIEKRIGKPIAKSVTLDVNQRGAIYAPLYAEGTSFHPGGRFIAGEEGIELGKYGNRFELLPFGMYDRPQGYKVFTHEETKKILNSLNNIPAYANGARTTHDVSNLVNQNNMSNVEALLQQLIYAVREGKNIILNGRVVGREITPYVTEEQERTNRFRGAFA